MVLLASFDDAASGRPKKRRLEGPTIAELLVG
jgi:hypothetical protein